MKPDYLLATHKPSDIQPFIPDLDELTRLAVKRSLDIDPKSPDGDTSAAREDKAFSADRFHQPARHGGSGILRLADRADTIYVSTLTDCFFLIFGSHWPPNSINIIYTQQ